MYTLVFLFLTLFHYGGKNEFFKDISEFFVKKKLYEKSKVNI